MVFEKHLRPLHLAPPHHHNRRIRRSCPRPLHETIHHALLTGAVELNRQLVAVDRGDVAVAEFLMKDAVAD